MQGYSVWHKIKLWTFSEHYSICSFWWIRKRWCPKLKSPKWPMPLYLRTRRVYWLTINQNIINLYFTLICGCFVVDVNRLHFTRYFTLLVLYNFFNYMHIWYDVLLTFYVSFPAFDWALHFHWDHLSPNQRARRKSSAEPIVYVCAAC